MTVADEPRPWGAGTAPPTSVPRADAGGSQPTVSIPFTWDGSPWRLTGLCMLNALLSLVTVGIYSFWGRTEIRRRMWSSVRLLGEPLVYHGTAVELLKGFLAVLAVLLVPLFLVGSFVVVYFGQASATFGIYQIALFAVVYPILTAIAFYRARRYRLARTSWRGIRGSLEGSSTPYGLASWALALAYPLTLFWIAPFRAVALQRMIVADTHLGAIPLRFEGGSGPVYRRYALLWFGSVFLYFAMFAALGATIGAKYAPDNPLWWMAIRSRDWAVMAGIVVATIFVWSLMSSFYYAKLYSHLAASTHWGGVEGGTLPQRFELDVRGWQIMWLFFTNSLITYLSLYVLRPIATARSMKYYAERLRLVGPFEPADLQQNRAAVDQTGEGLAQAFDLDAF